MENSSIGYIYVHIIGWYFSVYWFNFYVPICCYYFPIEIIYQLECYFFDFHSNFAFIFLICASYFLKISFKFVLVIHFVFIFASNLESNDCHNKISYTFIAMSWKITDASCSYHRQNFVNDAILCWATFRHFGCMQFAKCILWRQWCDHTRLPFVGLFVVLYKLCLESGESCFECTCIELLWSLFFWKKVYVMVHCPTSKYLYLKFVLCFFLSSVAFYGYLFLYFKWLMFSGLYEDFQYAYRF